jgi:hypothetical protein
MKTLDIFGKKYRIIKKDLNSQGLCGFIDYENKKIYLNKELDEKGLFETILHESFHGINERLSFNIAGIGGDFEEVLVDTYAKFVSEKLDDLIKIVSFVKKEKA